MSLVHDVVYRSAEALRRADPFADEPLLRVVDPVSGAGHHAALPDEDEQSLRTSVAWWRLVLLWLAMTATTVLLAFAQPAHGHDRVGSGNLGGTGLLRDVDFLGIIVVWACYLVVIVLARRAVGALLVTLERGEVIAPWPDRPWRPRPTKRLLQVLERVTRLTRRSCLAWGAGLLVLNLGVNVPSVLGDGIQTWRSDPSTQGTLLAVFASGSEQPSLAGIWHLGIASAIAGYLMLLLARLYVVFACLSEQVAADPSLRIRPTHPDGSGGVVAIGQAALFLALAIFASGLGLTVIAVQALVSHTPFNTIFLLLCALYLTVGPLLFFLPQWQLRRRMIRAKTRYLKDAERLFCTVETEHRAHLAGGHFDSGALQGKATLSALITQADDMAVWPFDRKTSRRFMALLISPVLPVILERLSPVLKQIPVVGDLVQLVLTP